MEGEAGVWRAREEYGERGRSALSMLSIHSPDYVFTVLVSIFMKSSLLHYSRM